MSTERNPQTGASLQPLVSDLASDGEMAELIEFFLGELDQGLVRLRQAWETGNTSELCRLVHQLKGAAGGYGFPSITSQAAELEQLLLAGQSHHAALNEKVEDLITLCRRASSSASSSV